MRPKFYTFDINQHVSQESYIRSLQHLIGSPIVKGNHIEIQKNGDNFFPDLYREIEQAKDHINLETFVFWKGEEAEKLTNKICEAAQRGVTCNLVLDGYGAFFIAPKNIKKMKRCGVHVHFFKPLRIYTFWRVVWHNHRTHRKLIIIDGKLGYIGGIGFSDLWSGNAQDKDHWRDTHFKVTGPIVNLLQGVFLDNWTIMTGSVLQSEKYFPKLTETGENGLLLVKSFPSDGCSNMRLLVLSLINKATTSIDFCTPYLLPDRNIRKALYQAVERGVKVRIMTAGEKTDKMVALYASLYYWKDLFQKGVELYIYEKTFMHQKLWIVDGDMVSLGSSNLDYRSIFTNYEANLVSIDQGFSKSLLDVFNEDIKECVPYPSTPFFDPGFYTRCISFLCSRIRYLL